MLNLLLTIFGFFLIALLVVMLLLLLFTAAGVVAAGALLERIGDLLVPGRKTGLGATGIVDQSGFVVRRPSEHPGGSLAEGTIQVAGELWTARSSTGDPLEEGSRVRVVAVEGMVAVVEPAPRRSQIQS